MPVKTRSNGSSARKKTSKKLVTASSQESFAQETLARRIRASGFISLPTLTAREGQDWSRAEVLARLDNGDGVAKRICALSSRLRSSKVVLGLNPCFAAAMMGYSPRWDACAPTAIQLTRGSRHNSSAVYRRLSKKEE